MNKILTQEQLKILQRVLQDDLDYYKYYSKKLNRKQKFKKILNEK
jgi:hypothetical protein